MDKKGYFSVMLAQARRQNGVAQSFMARAAGYSLRTVSAVEKGLQEPSVLAALRMATAVGANVAEMFSNCAGFLTSSSPVVILPFFSMPLVACPVVLRPLVPDKDK